MTSASTGERFAAKAALICAPAQRAVFAASRRPKLCPRFVPAVTCTSPMLAQHGA